jgi:uncharacterized protein
MRGIIFRALSTTALVLLLAGVAHAQFVEIPPLNSPVIDTVGVLGDYSAQLERTLRDLKSEKGSEVAVLIISSTKPETIEQYSIRVVAAWKLGRKGIDDGALLLIALQDRTVRIEVGRGLEGDLPDAKANRIIQERVIPRFKAGDIRAGIEDGVNAIVATVRGVELPPPPSHDAQDLSEVMSLLFIPCFVGGLFLSALFGKGVGASVSGVTALLAGWLAASFLIAIPLAAFCAMLVFFSDPKVATSGRRHSRYYYSGGRGPWGGGGFGGGGFGGGGGSFSGGGASGRW